MKKVYVLLFSLILLLGITPVFASAAPHHKHISDKPVTEVIQEETCTTSGSYKNIYYCKTCGKFIKSDIVKVKATGHDWVKATCITPETCNNCGKTKGNAHGHKWEEATCTTPETCFVCGETNGEALGHVMGEAILQVEWEPTCEETGRYKYNYYCTACEKFLKFDRVEVDALGHNWKDATCTTPETCFTCGKTNGEAPGHVMGEAVLEVEWEPTCEETGRYKYNYYCTVCEKFLKFDRVEVDALGHNWKDATCTTPETCFTCGKTNGEAVGHVMGEAVLEVEWEPTCEETGRYKYNYYCTVCEKFLKFDRVEVDALGHNWKDATCTTPDTCLTCGKTNGEAVGHVMGEAVLEVKWEPTCDETGRYKYNYYCTACEKFLKFDRVEVDALGHNWEEATCTTPDTCLTCGKTNGEADGHDWKKSKCGLYKTCSDCGEKQNTDKGTKIENDIKFVYTIIKQCYKTISYCIGLIQGFC